jgi:hypothetical protein
MPFACDVFGQLAPDHGSQIAAAVPAEEHVGKMAQKQRDSRYREEAVQPTAIDATRTELAFMPALNLPWDGISRRRKESPRSEAQNQ